MLGTNNFPQGKTQKRQWENGSFIEGHWIIAGYIYEFLEYKI